MTGTTVAEAPERLSTGSNMFTGAVTARFKIAAHAAVAVGAKRLDARPAGDSRYASVKEGWILNGVDTQGNKTISKVLSRTTFPSFRIAYAFYKAIGLEDALLPPEWVTRNRGIAKAITTAEEAAEFYNSMFTNQKIGRTANRSNVRLQHQTDPAILVFELEAITANTELHLEYSRMCAEYQNQQVTAPTNSIEDATELSESAPTNSIEDARTELPELTPTPDNERPGLRLLLKAVEANAELKQKVLSAWRRVTSTGARTAYLVLTKRIQKDAACHPTMRVLVRRTKDSPDAPWILPGVDEAPRQHKAIINCLAQVSDASASRSDQIVEAMASRTAKLVTRRTMNVISSALVMPMRGQPLASQSDEWAWMDAKDITRGCQLALTASLAVNEALRWEDRTAERVAQSFGAKIERKGATAPESNHLSGEVSVSMIEASQVSVHSARRATATTLTCPAQEEIVRVAMAEASDATLNDNESYRVDENYLNKLIEGARATAYSRGSTRVTPRDVATEANKIARAGNKPNTKVSRPSPAEAIPENYNELIVELRRVATMIARHREAGMPKPRVLIVGESHGVLAKLFAMAGADVATCDLKATETKEFPHYQGDAKWIRDLGWDLVISHPPCTYLSNAGVMWLTREPERHLQVVEAASTYRQMRSATAPFRITENPKMHGLAKRLTRRRKVQYVQPWQHGTGHTKAMGLETTVSEAARAYAFQPLEPTLVVPGREHAMANLPESPNRGDQRSRTYIGIGAAMAIQWLPNVVKYLSDHHTGEKPPTANQLVEQARNDNHIEAAKVCFYTHHQGEILILGHERTDGGIDVIGGKRDDNDEPIAATMFREIKEEVSLDPEWRRLLRQAIMSNPRGHAAHSIVKPRREQQHHVHAWGVEIPANLIHLAPELKEEGRREIVDGSIRWQPLTAFLGTLRENSMKAYADLFEETIFNAGERLESETIASMAQPWNRPRPPREEWEPQCKHIRYSDRRWRAWSASEEETNLNDGKPKRLRHFKWQALPTEINEALDRHLRSTAQHADVTDQPLLEIPTKSQTDSAKVQQAWTHLRKYAATPTGTAETVALVNEENKQQWASLRKLWSCPREQRNRLGLGATKEESKDSRHWTETKRLYNNNTKAQIAAQRAAIVRISYADSFVKEEEKLSLSDVVAATEEDIATPVEPIAAYHRNCMYMRGVSVCRLAQTRNTKDRHYRVDAAMTVAKTLMDTGAGPSCITTQLLAMFPTDACVERESNSEQKQTNGPDGKPLRTHGHAVIVFYLNGTYYKHRFLVVEGKPLLLLGNDFLDAYKADIRYSDEGRGVLTLRQKSKNGQTTEHTVDITCDAAKAFAVDTVSTCSEETGSSLQQEQTPTGDNDTSSTITYERLPGLDKPVISAEEMLKEHLEVGQSEQLIFTEEAIIVPPRSKATVWLRAPLELKGKKASYLIEHLTLRPGIDPDIPAVECRLVTPTEDGHRIPVTIWNTSRKAYHIPAYAPLAQLSVEHEILVVGAPTKDTELTYARLTKEQKELIDKIEIDRDNELTEEQKGRVRDLLAKYIAVFAIDPKDPGHTQVMEVELPLKPDAAPHRHAATRSGEAGREIIEKHVAEMESRGIIRKSNSAWSSRIVLVKKKGGEIRFCIDYRDTNSKLLYLDSPIPLTIEALDRLSSGKGDRASLFLSTLDLASGFWCLPIKEKDKGLTAFSTGRAKYEFNYLPFGIQSGPSYMCRLMDAVLQGLAWEICMPYLDDVACWSTGQGETPAERQENSFEQHMVRMDLILGRLRGAGLTCKASKCVMFATECEYLGHIVGREGLKMDPAKISKVEAIDPKGINTLERVRAFLGLCSYYRRFISGFSKIATPLTDLTQKGVDVETQSQTDLCQEAIIKLKAAITSEPVLAAPRFDRIFKVKTDGALTEGLGGVLGQDDDDGHERVVAYYGRRLTKHERNYTVTEIELLAALESIRNWRPYLWGRKFKLIIDHAALKWLHTMRDTIEGGPASRLMRWILKLAEYDFDVEHKAGKVHTDADGLSRLVAALEIIQRDEWDKQTIAAVTAEEPKKKVRHQRKAVVTARRLQRAERTKRNESTTRESVLIAYLSPPSLTKSLSAAQAEDPECNILKTHLRHGSLPTIHDRTTLRKARWVAKETRNLTIREELLVHVQPGSAKETAFVPESLRWPLMTAFHDHLGHQGMSRMLALMRDRYYWPGMHADVREYVGECHECTLAKLPPRSQKTARKPTIGSYPFDLLYCDVADMAPTWDYDAEKGTGYKKALVFADSLSHWVEVIPFHSDPTSENVLDAFMTHIVSRYGAPRAIASDLGSNLSSNLCREIQRQTGVDLTFSPSDHHESAGLVERFIQTLTVMTRTSDEGGEHWVDHLPFLLMSYRATPTRVTKMSPAELLYGRQLRLPAQLGEESVPSGADDLPEEITEYAKTLMNRIQWAWESARNAIHQSQTEHESDTAKRSVERTFAVDERVCRFLPKKENKLLNLFAGPYRIEEVLSTGRYRLKDLENKILSETFDVSQLRPYRTEVDAEELQPDEYLVDEIINHQGEGARRKYQVKWRGYARAQATWEPREELMRRCHELINEYETSVLDETEAFKNEKVRSKERKQKTATEVLTSIPALRKPNEYESDDVPTTARYARGRWGYGRFMATPRGRRLRWFAPSAFTPEELNNAHFKMLRDVSSAKQADVALTISWEQDGVRKQ